MIVERKKGKWSESASRVLKERYLWRKDGKLLEDEDGMCARVARAVAEAERTWGATEAEVDRAAEQFSQVMLDRQFMPNSPTLMNAGKNNGQQLSACFVLPVGDSLPEIFDAIKHAAIIHKSGGGCISGDAHVFTTFCGVEAISTLYERVRATGQGEELGAGHAVMDVRGLGIRTMALDPERGTYQPAPLTHLWRYDVPLADQLRIRCANGLTVTTSVWHPFMVFDGRSFVERRADELKPGDILSTPNASVRDNWPHSAYREVAGMVLDEDIAWLLGYYLGDGSLGWAKVPEGNPRREKLRWRVFDGRTASLERARAILSTRFNVHVQLQRDGRGLYSLTSTDAAFIAQFRNLLDVHPGPKEDLPFPEMVAKSPLPVVGAFLAGLVDADGFADGTRDRVTFTSTAKGLTEKVHTLCALLGLAPGFRAREPYGKGRTVCYEVRLAAEPRIADLQAVIGAHLTDSLKAERLAAMTGTHTNVTAQHLPIPFSAVEDMLESVGIATATTAVHRHAVQVGDRRFWLHNWKEGRGVSGETLLPLIAALRPLVAEPYQGRLNLLERIVAGGTAVQAIERPNAPVAFYDFTVEGFSTYLAGTNGLTAIHNTGFGLSRLRSEGSEVATTRGVASGPVSFLRVFNAATEAVKQGGCVVPDTRVSTTRGIVKIGTLGPVEAEPKSWHALAAPLSAYTDEGSRRVEEFYHNGLAPVRTIRTTHGYAFTGTLAHRVRVIDNAGAYVWRHLQDLKPGDWVVLQKNSYPAHTDYRFTPSSRIPHFNATGIVSPEQPTAELGELIGYFVGDGCINYYNSGGGTGRLILTVADTEPEVLERLVGSAANLFGVTPIRRKKPHDASTNLYFNSTEMAAWFTDNGVAKTSALDARIPEMVFQAGAEFARGFLRGLFTADGTITVEGYPSLTTISQNLASDTQQLLLSLGVPSSISVKTDRGGAWGTHPIYQVRVITLDGLREFAERIRFMAPAKNVRLQAGLTKAWEFNDIIPNQQPLVAALYAGPGRGSGPKRGPRGANSALYHDIQHYLPHVTAPRNLTRSRLATLAEKHEEVRSSPLAGFLVNEQFYDQVAAIEEGEAVTVDLSVEENHTYIANGFVSHNTRRGANMGVLRVDHPDILKFIECKRPDPVTGVRDITNFNISVAATDAFMEALEHRTDYELRDPHSGKVTGTLNAREVFDKICAAAWSTGDPGLLFIDRANHSASNPIPELEQIEATNPCLVADTFLATGTGMRRLGALHASGEALAVATDVRAALRDVSLREVVNGTALAAAAGVVFRPAVPVFQTGRRVPVLKLITSHGIEITATPNHRFLTTDGYRRLDELQFGDTLLLQSAEGNWSADPSLPFMPAFGTRGATRQAAWERDGKIAPPKAWSRELGEMLGYLVGDGYLRHDGEMYVIGMAVSDNDHALADLIQDRLKGWFGYRGSRVRRQGHLQLQYSGLVAAFFAGLGLTSAHAGEKRVPETIFGAPREAVVGFLRGLFSADGSVQSSVAKGACSVRLATSSRGMARDVQQLLLNFGIVSAIRLRRHAGFAILPDGARVAATYPTQAQYEVIIDKVNRDRFATEIGFLQEVKQEHLRAWISTKKRASNRETFTTQVALIEDAGLADVFDTTEPMTHSFIANGVVSHNCGEQWLGGYDACNLGSINLAECVTKQPDGTYAINWTELDRVTRVTTRFLDDVIEINPLPLPEINDTVRANRRVGLGIMGWADLLFLLAVPYDSEAALALGEEVMRFVNRIAHDESQVLAKARGAFPNFNRSIYRDGPPLRNATLTTVAPTGTISIIADCSSGIEPVFALAFTHMVDRGKPTERRLVMSNPIFARLAREQGFYSDALMEKISEHGSVVGLDEVPEKWQRVFVNAHEVSPEWHIRMQAAFQHGVDNSISKCLAAGTLVPTSEGLIAVEDFSEIEEPDTFVNIQDRGITIGGHRVLSHYFAGEKPATRIRLDNGAVLVGSTESHRVFGPDGWRRMSDLRVGDQVIGRFVESHGSGGVALPVGGQRRTNAKTVLLPERMSPPLAQFLGMLAADGHTTEQTGAVGITTVSAEVLAEFNRLANDLFGLVPRHSLDSRNSVQYLNLNSRFLCRWIKELIGEGAYGKHVPNAVLTGSAEEKLAFLRGVSLDGHYRARHGLYLYGGMSKRLAYGIAEVCRSFGLPLVRQEEVTVAYNGNTCHKVVVSNELQNLISCIEPHKNGATHYATYQVLVDHQLVDQTKLPTSHPYYSALRSIKQRQPWNCDDRTASRMEWPMVTPVHRVTAVEDGGILPLYDIEVEDAHAYTVNGIVSHNTVNLPNESSIQDIEDAYLMAWAEGCKGITVFRDGCLSTGQVLNVGTKDTPAAAPSVPTATPAPQPERPTPPLAATVKPRPPVVFGYTRQVKAPEGTANITINTDETGPVEVFLSVGRAGSDIAALAEALGRLISLTLRLPSPIEPDERLRLIATQLRGIGGSRSIGFGASRVLSLPDALGQAFMSHLEQGLSKVPAPINRPMNGNGSDHGDSYPTPTQLTLPTVTVLGNLCPQCGSSSAFVLEEGCKKCHGCGYSEC